MANFTKRSLYSAAATVAVAVATLVVVSEPAHGQKGKTGVLQPQMNPEGGLTKATGKLGEKPAQPWSATTLGAAVDGKANEGAAIKTVTGEIIDFACYLQIGKHG